MRNTRYSKYFTHIQLLIDLLIMGFVFVCFLSYQYPNVTGFPLVKIILYAHYKVLIIFSISWFFISEYIGLYKISRTNSYSYILKKNLIQISLFSIIVFSVSGLKSDALLSYRDSIYFISALFFLTLISRLMIFRIIRYYRQSGRNFRRVVFVDKNSNTNTFISLLKKRKDYGLASWGKFFVATVPSFNHDYQKGTDYNKYDKDTFKSYVLKEKVQIIFVSLEGDLSQEELEELVLFSQRNHIEVRLIPSTAYDSFSSFKLDYYDTLPVLVFKEFPLDNIINQGFKRLFDIMFSLSVIVFILSWLIPIIAISVLINSGYPIFYSQSRVGFKGKRFNCYKFRTMKFSKDNDIKATVRGDSRVTSIGRILRKTSLDELPQFFNVVKGNMSVVGPRPHMIKQDNYYNDLLVKYSLRHYVKPGITGLAQVKGFRGEISVKEDMIKRVTADVYYVKNWSFILDVIIILRTFFKTIGGDKKAF